MTPEEQQKQDIASAEPYMNGKQNFVIRMYFYINAGLTVLNNFRNLFLGIFAAYFALKLENPILIPIAFVCASFVLILLGWYQTHKMQKIFEWINLRFSSYYGIKQFNYSEGTYNLLVEIKDLLKQHKDGK